MKNVVFAVVLLFCCTSAFAQGGAPFKARLVYMVPSNRQPQPDAVKNIQKYGLSIQRLFRENMARAGAGEKTFLFETEPGSSIPKVNVLHASQPAEFFQNADYGGRFSQITAGLSSAGVPPFVRGEALLVFAEIQQQLSDGSFAPSSVFFGGAANNSSGVAIVTGETLARMSDAFLVDNRDLDGLIIPTIGPFPLVAGVTFPSYEGTTLSATSSSAQGGAAHELGHAFGLPHEFVNDNSFVGNLMGNGFRGLRGFLHARKYPAEDVRLTGSAALQLATSRFFNSQRSYTENIPPAAEILSAGVVPPEGGLFRVRFRASDGQSPLAAAILLRDGNVVGSTALSLSQTDTSISTYSYSPGVAEPWSVIVYDAQGNLTVSAPVMLTPATGFNQAPVPFIKINRTRISAGDTVGLDASLSRDPDGAFAQLRVEWDFDGDSQFDTAPSSSLTRTTAFAQPGVYQVKARLTDATGDAAISASIGIRVDPPVVNAQVSLGTPIFSSDATGCPSGYAGKYSLSAVLRNTSLQTLSNLSIDIQTLTGGNLLLADGALYGEEELIAVPAPGDGLVQNETLDVPLVVCADTELPFELLVNVRGVSLTVTPVNNPPVANPASVGTAAGTPVSGTLVAIDVEGNPLTYAIVTNGAKGTASVTSAATGAYTYTPNAGATGADSFTFKANDGTADSNVAIITVTIGPAGASPIPQTNWTLKFVDSQETVGEDGAATNAFDGNPNTYWHTKWSNGADPVPHEIQINLGASYSVSGFRHLPRPNGATNGRIAQYEFYVSPDGATWGAAVATGTLANVATQQDVTFSAKTGQFVQLRVLAEVAGRPFTSMAELGVLGGAPAVVNQPADSVIQMPVGAVVIAPGQTVNFTGAGSDPENDLPLAYHWDFGGAGPASSNLQNPGAITFPNAGVFTITFTVTDGLGHVDPTPATRTITVQSGSTSIPPTNWTLKFVDSQETIGENGAATNAFDGDPNTMWHTKYSNGTDPVPHEMQINLGASHNISGFRYLPRQDGGTNGRIAQFEFYVSTDGATWGYAVATGTLANVATQQDVTFSAKTGRFVRLRVLSEVAGRPFASMAELGVLGGVPPVVNQPAESVIQTPVANVVVAQGQAVNFTGSGTDPENDLPLAYHWDFGGAGPAPSNLQNAGAITFPNAGVFTVSFTVTDGFGHADPTPASRTITVQSGSGPIPQTNWTLKSVDSQETIGENGAATNAFDGNPNTYWHTKWSNGADPVPHEIQINLGASYNVSGFRHLPRPNGATNGRIAQFEFYVSADGVTWGSAVATGTLANVATQQEVTFATKTGRFIKLRALTEVAGRAFTSVGELGILATATP